MKWIDLRGVPILEQLQLEEALLRSETESFCLVNFGSPRAIVMGISGEPALLLHKEKIQRDKIPVIRRFSGGGTVIVDESTLFVTFIFDKNLLPISAFPEAIHRWAADLYTSAWNIPGFHYRENDYAIGEHKCGGNAQYITKKRWLHHTSFLWDFRNEHMDYLRLPPKRPTYRGDRPHEEFLCRLNAWAKSPEVLIAQLKEELAKRFLLEDWKKGEEQPHRKSVEIVEIQH